MKKGWKIAFIVLGSIAGAVALDVGISLIVNKATEVETIHNLKGETFNEIDIDVTTADVEFTTYGNEYNVKCIESSYAKHNVRVENKVLKIDSTDTYTPFLLVSPKRKITIYIPKNITYRLNVHHTTGDLFIVSDYKFSDVTIKGSTGDVKFSGPNMSGKLDIYQTTGDIDIGPNNAQCEIPSAAKIETSTGSIKLEAFKCSGELNLKSSTGNKYLDFVRADKMKITSSTGDVEMKSCDANELDIKTSTGDVTAEFLTSKIVYAKSSTGNIDIPKSTTGGLCSIETSTGDIKVTFKK